MANSRKEAGLTTEQQTLIDQFGQIIASKDAEKKLIDIIEKLEDIPAKASPLRLVAYNQDHALIEYFIKIATQRAILDAESRAAADRNKFLETGHYTPPTSSEKDYFPRRFIQLMRCIYYGAINGYAAARNVAKVDAMLEQFEKWLKDDSSKAAQTKFATLFFHALEGYEKGGHFDELESLWARREMKRYSVIIGTIILITRYFAKNSKFDEVSQMIGFFPKNEAVKDAAIEGYKLSGNDFEILKINKLKEIMNEVDKVIPDYYQSKRKEKIFELIDAIPDQALKKSLLIDCIYRGTQLGYEMWFKRSVTSTLKRGVLNKIVKKLVEMGVNIATLPGCEIYNSSWLSTSYPSKTHLVGMWPHSPARNRETLVVIQSRPDGNDTDSDNEDISPFMSITDAML